MNIITDLERNRAANEIEDDSKELLHLKKKKQRQEKALHLTRKEIWAVTHKIERNKNIINN